VLLRTRPEPGQRILDCGAGYSPVPFLCASRGALVTALDRDAVVATRLQYAGWCVARAAEDLVAGVFGRQSRQPSSSRPGPLLREMSRRDALRRKRSGRLRRFLRYQVTRNRDRLARLVRPDFWGPVSPTLLRRYGVRYERGDLTRLGFPATSFDVVICISVLEHMPREARLGGVREMARVLAPAGRLILTYDVVDGDLSDELIAATSLKPVEAVYFHASRRLYAANAPDVIGLVLSRPMPADEVDRG
jgi:SAM-dependent methyltransferase